MLKDSLINYVIDTAYVMALEYSQGMVPPEGSAVRLNFYSKIATVAQRVPNIENDNRVRNLINAIDTYER